MGVVPMPADFGAVENRSFTISSFRLQIGAVMPQAKVAYETYCRLAADGRNAALITDGYTQRSHHAAGRNPANGNLPGWWYWLCQHQPADRQALWLGSLPIRSR